MKTDHTENYQILVVGKGDKVVDGKTHFQDFVSVYIDDHKEAFTLAMNILRQVEAQQFREKKEPVQFNLTGALEDEED